jgi:hypothetical protein
MIKLSFVIFILLLMICQAIPMNITYQFTSGSDSWYRCDAKSQEGSAVVLDQSFCGNWASEIPGASWIWYGQNNDAVNVTFFKYFYIPGIVNSVTACIEADNQFTLYLNTKQTSCLAAYGTYFAGTMLQCDITNFARTGMNLLRIDVLNAGGPGGLLYKVSVNSYIV